MNVFGNILEAIGNSPLVRINNLNPNPDVTIYAKFEGMNPTGSIKDRIALNMIEAAEKSGDLHKGKIIIEPTSGNTGIGLAMIGAVKGYQVEIVMSESVSIERRQTMRAYGCKILLTDGKLGTDGAIKKARTIVAENPDKYFMPDQFSNKYNKLAHYSLTAEEIWRDTNGNLDYFVSALGTSGTVMGVGKRLREYNPKIKIAVAHPVLGHYIQGLKNMKEAIVPSIYNPDEIDEHVSIESEVAFDWARKVVLNEGIFVGMSSGAAMYAAAEIAKKIKSGTIVCIFPDSGWKYLSTKLWEVPSKI